jgi:hypothetical protein
MKALSHTEFGRCVIQIVSVISVSISGSDHGSVGAEFVSQAKNLLINSKLTNIEYILIAIDNLYLKVENHTSFN